MHALIARFHVATELSVTHTENEAVDYESVTGVNLPHRAHSTDDCGGPGHTWLKRLFITFKLVRIYSILAIYFNGIFEPKSETNEGTI